MSTDDVRVEQPATAAVRTSRQVAFRTSREGMTQLIEADLRAADLLVPACPAWTVRDLLAHVVGHCRPERSEAGHDGRPLRPLDELGVDALLDEWAWTGPLAERLLGEHDSFGHRIWVMDMFTHELDLRRALDVPPAADGHPAFRVAWEVVLAGFSAAVASRGLPAVRLETEEAQWVAGSGKEAATVRAPWLDLFRSLAGRRTHEQIAGLAWSVPADLWLPAFTWGPFAPPPEASEPVIGRGPTGY